MARLQILQLPEAADDERPPFALIIDQVTYDEGGQFADGTESLNAFALKAGARASAVFHGVAVDLPANAPASLPLMSAEMEVVDVIDPKLADLVLKTVGIELASGGVPLDEALRNACRQLEKSEAAREHLRRRIDRAEKRCEELRAESLRRGKVKLDYAERVRQLETAIRRALDICGDQGSDVQDILRPVLEAAQDDLLSRRDALLDALGLDRTRDWDDIVNVASGLRKGRDARAAVLERVRNLFDKPEAMDSQHPDPSGYLHGYKVAIGDAKRAARSDAPRPCESGD